MQELKSSSFIGLRLVGCFDKQKIFIILALLHRNVLRVAAVVHPGFGKGKGAQLEVWERSPQPPEAKGTKTEFYCFHTKSIHFRTLFNRKR